MCRDYLDVHGFIIGLKLASYIEKLHKISTHHSNS